MRGQWLISLLALLILAGPVRAEVVLIMRREAQLSGNYVRICDIARVEGPEEQAREVAMTVLGPAPSERETRYFSRWDVETRLYEMGVTAKVSFSGNDSVRVYGNGVARQGVQSETITFGELDTIPEQTFRRRENGRGAGGEDDATMSGAWRRLEPLEKPAPRTFERADTAASLPIFSLQDDVKRRVGLAVSNYLANRYKEGGKRSDIEVEAKILNVSANIPYSAHEIRVEEGVDGRVPGKALLRAMVRDTAESELREVKIEADTQVFAQALVASRQLSRGDTLELHDVVVTRVRMDAGQAYLPPSPKAAVGRELKRSLKSGDPLLAEDAVPGQAVKRGQVVEIVTMGQGWMVQGSGKAMGSGMIGDHITVEDSTTKAKFTAKITGRGKASVMVNKNRFK